MKRSRSILVTASLILMGFSACAQPPRELVFRITWTDYSGRGVAIQNVVDAFNQTSKTTHVTMQGGDEDVAVLSALLEDDQHQTVYVLPYRYVRAFGNDGRLMELGSQFETEKAWFYPQLWNLGSVNDQTYGIPWVSHSICLIYNKSLLDLAGVDPTGITSLDALVDALKQVEAKTDAQGIGLVGANHNDISWMVNQFIYGFGSSLVDESGTKVTLNNAASVAALDFYKNVLGAHAQPTWIDDTGVEVMNAFRSQSIAFEFQGVWGVTDIEKNGSPFETGIIKLEDIGLSPEVGPLMLAIEPDMSAADQASAVEFIRYMISSSAQESIMKGEYSAEHDHYYPFRVPARKDLTDALVFQENPQYIPFTLGYAHPSIDVPTARWQTIKTELYAPGLHEVMKGTLDIQTFLNQIETEGNKILNP